MKDAFAQQGDKGKVSRLGPEEMHGHASQLHRLPHSIQGTLQLQILQRKLEEVLHLLLQGRVFRSIEGPLQKPQEIILQL